MSLGLATAYAHARTAGLDVRIEALGAPGLQRRILAELDRETRTIRIDAHTCARLHAAGGEDARARFVTAAIAHELAHFFAPRAPEDAVHAAAAQATGIDMRALVTTIRTALRGR